LSCDGSSSIEVSLLGLSLVELLEKAQGVTNKAYGHSLRSFACIEGALDRMPKGTKGGEELAQLLGKAQSVQKTIAEIQQCITQTTETLSQEVRVSLHSFCQSHAYVSLDTVVPLGEEREARLHDDV
jgi:hypothetical protein